MSNRIIIGSSKALKGEITPPGDKSISHRSLMLGSLATGTTLVRDFLISDDTLTTANAMRALGASIEINGTQVLVKGNGLHGLKEPDQIIDCGNSGTTTRLLIGLLSPQQFTTTLTGDKYLQARPMKRVVSPLAQMGAKINGNEEGNKLPLTIIGSNLKGISYELPVASAQVKSAILIAGLYAEGETEVIEPEPSRDHTERMLAYLGVPIKKKGHSIKINKVSKINPGEIIVPSDISSAAFFIVAALITPGSEVLIKNVGINPLRTGIIDILKNMGGDIEIINERDVNGEPIGDILTRSSNLHATEISGDVIPKAIDELPLVAVAASFAEGETLIKDAKELRVKETDRIHAMATELGKLGAEVEEFEDGMSIIGTQALTGATCSSWGDHRIAMSIAIAALRAKGETEIIDADCVSVSYPGFFEVIDELRQ
ncbi:MAG: 3-phosphoshikimate 1-carboxyvinyltransferase [Thermodesulfobacteriales bacterium]|nr:MAG: 3-phosphoshikimate 1-carboxyvinyltransferase [Thermodesulfobacteriales bacterium]